MKNKAPQYVSLGNFTQTLLQHPRASGLYAVAILGAALLAGLLCLLPVTGTAFTWLKLLQLVALLSLGLFHTLQLYKRLSFLHRNFSNEGLWYTLLLFIILLLAFTGFYWLTNASLLPMAIAGSSAFLFPFLIYRAWFYYSHIPAAIYTAWYLPESDTANYASTARNSLSLQIKLSRTYFDTDEALFTVATTPQTKLGRLFFNFIQDQHKQDATAIQLADEAGKPYAWEFYAIEWFGLLKRRMNPGASLVTNKIKKNSSIIVKRVKAATAPVPQQMIAV